MMNNNYLYFTEPAQCKEEAFLIGNGRIGGIVYGGYNEDRISLNDSTYWTGVPFETKCENGPEKLKEIKEIFDSGDKNKANSLIGPSFASRNSDRYMPLGYITVNTPCFEGTDEYKRTLDMSTGVTNVEYSLGDKKVKKNSFVSFIDNALVYKVTCENVDEIIIKYNIEIENDVEYNDSTINFSGFMGKLSYDENGNPVMDYDIPDEEKGIKYFGNIAVKTNSEIERNNDSLRIINPCEVIIYFTVRTSFTDYKTHPYLNPGAYKEQCLKDTEKVINKSYESVLDAHIKDFSALYNRTEFSLCDSENDKTTVDTLKSKDNNAIYVLLFNVGKYLTIAGSRPGTQAMNLQGIWNESFNPPWGCQYTININAQMNYMPTLRMNLEECFEPYVDLAKVLSITGEKVAKEFYGIDNGVVSHHNSDIWGLAHPVSKGDEYAYMWSFFRTSYGWILQGLYEKYLVEKDEAFLRDTFYPLLKKCANGFAQMVDEENGKYFLKLGTSPENYYNYYGNKISIAKYTAMENGIISFVFETMAKLAAKYGENDLADKYNDLFNNMIGYEIGEDGRLLEWDDSYFESEVQHRHVSHIWGLHPARQITKEGTPDLAKACEKSLNVRGDGGTGWCIAWKANMWARLRDGNRALNLIDNQLTFVDGRTYKGYERGGTYANLLCAHSPFQIDGNFGAASAIMEMLADGDGENVQYLPALPDKWKSGYMKGLRVNGKTVNIYWDNGLLTKVEEI